MKQISPTNEYSNVINKLKIIASDYDLNNIDFLDDENHLEAKKILLNGIKKIEEKIKNLK